MRRLAPVLALVLGLGARSALAFAPPEPPATESISRALDEGRIGEALMMAEDAAAATPDDPVLQLSLAQILMMLQQRERARELIDGVIARAPEAVEPRFLSASLLLEEGDLSAAREAAEKALSLDPEFPPSQVLRGEIELRDTIRRGEQAAHEPGTAEATVLQVIDQLEKDELEALVECCIGEGLKLSFDASPQNLPTAQEIRTFWKGFREGYAQSRETTLVGHVVDLGEHEPDRAAIPVHLLLERTLSREGAERLGRWYDDPVLRNTLAAEEQRILGGLDEAQREAYLSRLVDVTSRRIHTVWLEMSRDSKGDWRVDDVALGDRSDPQLRLTRMLLDQPLQSALKRADAGVDAESEPSPEEGIPLWIYALGTIGFAGVVCGYVAFGGRR